MWNSWIIRYSCSHKCIWKGLGTTLILFIASWRVLFMKANYLELGPIIYEFHEFRRESHRLLLTNIELWIWFNCVLKVILWNLLEPYFFWQFVSNIMRVVDNINCPAGSKQTGLLNATKLAQCICNFICQSGKSKVFNYNHRRYLLWPAPRPGH